MDNRPNTEGIKQIENVITTNQKSSLFKSLCSTDNENINDKQQLLFALINYKLSDNNKNMWLKINDEMKLTLKFKTYEIINTPHARILSDIQRFTNTDVTALKSKQRNVHDRFIKQAKETFKKKMVNLKQIL